MVRHPSGRLVAATSKGGMMTQAPEEETVELAIVACETCDQLFLCSPRRESCPTCGGPAGLRFFEFLGDASGVHLRDGTLAALAAEPAAPPAEAPAAGLAAPVPAAEEEPMMIGPVKGKVPIAGAMFGGFLAGEDVDVDCVKDWLLELGAEPEDAATAVGRLVAVRDLIRDLVAADAEPEVAVDVEVEPAEIRPPAAAAGEGDLPAAPEPAQVEGDQDSEPPGSA